MMIRKSRTDRGRINSAGMDGLREPFAVLLLLWSPAAPDSSRPPPSRFSGHYFVFTAQARLRTWIIDGACRLIIRCRSTRQVTKPNITGKGSRLLAFFGRDLAGYHYLSADGSASSLLFGYSLFPLHVAPVLAANEDHGTFVALNSQRRSRYPLGCQFSSGDNVAPASYFLNFEYACRLMINGS
ncbi:hypothetical protein SEVIR_9G170150v4 [Setaria viridis]